MRVALATAYLVYLACLGWLVFAPGGDTPGGTVVFVDALLGHLGLHVDDSLVEPGLNVVLFVPLSLLGAPLLRWWPVLGWLVVGLVLASAIELAQLAIPGRVSSLKDVACNTAGSVSGALVWLLVHRLTCQPQDREGATR